MRKIRFGDFIILVIIIAAGIFITVKHTAPNAGKVLVSADNKKYEYSLSQDNTYSVPGLLGNTVFEIKNGKIRILESPCPNKTCIGMGWTDMVICLPNQVYISITEDKTTSGDFDAITK